jgi:hypothetical protein
LFEHDLFGKPVSTFPDHALGGSAADKGVRAQSAKKAPGDLQLRGPFGSFEIGYIRRHKRSRISQAQQQIMFSM